MAAVKSSNSNTFWISRPSRSQSPSSSRRCSISSSSSRSATHSPPPSGLRRNIPQTTGDATGPADSQSRRIADDVGMERDRTLFADRSNRAKLRVHGPKRLWFLHQQLTQAFEDMTPGSVRDAAMITVHGRLRGYLETVATEDAVLCHFEPELRPGLIEELSRFAPLIPVEIDDVTEDWGLVLVAGPALQEAAGTPKDAVSCTMARGQSPAASCSAGPATRPRPQSSVTSSISTGMSGAKWLNSSIRPGRSSGSKWHRTASSVATVSR